MPSKNRFEVHGDTISITRDGWDCVVQTTYREDYYDELSSHTWSLKDGYPYNATLGGGLHRYIISKWYGQDVLDDMTNRGYVVDHMNNCHTDCRLSNLEFLKHNRNVAKGQYFDKESETMRHDLAVSMFKDFKTNCYQITIGCNATIASTDANGKAHYINDIKLLYNCGYSQVVLDAEKILSQFDEERRFSLVGLSCCDVRVTEAPAIELTEEEKDHVIVERDGHQYLVIGNGKTFLHSVHYDENWYPPQK